MDSRTKLLRDLQLVLVLFLMCIWSVHFVGRYDPSEDMMMMKAVNEKTGCSIVDQEQPQPKGFVHTDITYGHVHMAKTAGTEVNGMLATRFERVCGHKGNSYDLYQSQRRRDSGERDDSITKLFPQAHFNRGRVPRPFLEEVGYEDCDYISQEEKWDVWPDIIKNFNLELHVPCRDPLQHLMSQCHSKGAVFDCNAKDLKAEVEKCYVFINRFSNELTKTNATVKCFDPIPLERYVEYMDHKLQQRKVPFEYTRVSKPRDSKTSECIWDHPNLVEKVKEIMLENDYYQFCNQCTGTDMDLFHGAEVSDGVL